MLPSIPVVDQLLSQAKVGSGQAVEQLLEAYKEYLRQLANQRLGKKLAVRLSASDLVQETMLVAWKEFEKFRGDNARQFSVWIRTILLRQVSAAVSLHLKTAKRDVQRERSNLRSSGSSIVLSQCLHGREQTPSTILTEFEDAARVHQVLSQLPEEYRLVIQWRNFEGVQFHEIAQRLGKTNGAARLVWLRAIRTLRSIYQWQEEG